jgi:hypothetical protein
MVRFVLGDQLCVKIINSTFNVSSFALEKVEPKILRINYYYLNSFAPLFKKVDKK